MERCNLCDLNLGPRIVESTHWQLVLNRNQNLLGKCFLALRRHLEAVPQLSSDEWADLHQQLVRATQALSQAFQPAHFNYAFLQNQDRHVHLHIIPRYAESRVFGGLTFDDPDYPAHYTVPSSPRYLAQKQLVVLAERLRGLLVQTRVQR
jgi:diadenosine tetraphosphate (Ap4A) HIT family hydrolase